MVLWKRMDHWIVEKEIVYEDCDHVATWVKNYVESSVIRGMVKEWDRSRMVLFSVKTSERTQSHNRCLT